MITLVTSILVMLSQLGALKIVIVSYKVLSVSPYPIICMTRKVKDVTVSKSQFTVSQ